MARVRATSEVWAGAKLAALVQTQADLVAFAKKKHAEVMNADPRPTSFRRVVDGKIGAPEESVDRHGVIEYRYQRLGEVVQFAMDTLFALSPVLSGEYRGAHTLFVNGVAASSLAEWQPSDEEIYIINPLEYARVIELGRMKMRVPGSDRVYQQAAEIVKRRFGNVAAVKFTYRPVANGAFFAAGDTKGPVIRGPRGRFAKGSHSRPGRALDVDARRPALYIRAY